MDGRMTNVRRILEVAVTKLVAVVGEVEIKAAHK
jgi:hypothetical protein